MIIKIKMMILPQMMNYHRFLHRILLLIKISIYKIMNGRVRKFNKKLTIKMDKKDN